MHPVLTRPWDTSFPASSSLGPAPWERCSSGVPALSHWCPGTSCFQAFSFSVWESHSLSSRVLYSLPLLLSEVPLLLILLLPFRVSYSYMFPALRRYCFPGERLIWCLWAKRGPCTGCCLWSPMLRTLIPFFSYAVLGCYIVACSSSVV